MQHDYVHIRLIYVRMQHSYVHMQHNYDSMLYSYFNMRLKLCCTCCFFMIVCRADRGFVNIDTGKKNVLYFKKHSAHSTKNNADCSLNLDLQSYASVLKGDGTDPIGQAVWYFFEYKKNVQ